MGRSRFRAKYLTTEGIQYGLRILHEQSQQSEA
jgi:hypothetical protein